MSASYPEYYVYDIRLKPLHDICNNPEIPLDIKCRAMLLAGDISRARVQGFWEGCDTDAFVDKMNILIQEILSLNLDVVSNICFY